MFVQYFKRFVLMLLATAMVSCTSNSVDVYTNDKILMVSWEYGLLYLDNGVSIESPNGVEFYTESGIVDTENLPTKTWIFVKKVDPNSGWFTIVSPKQTRSEVKLLKEGDEDCPKWSPETLIACEVFEFPIKGKSY